MMHFQQRRQLLSIAGLRGHPIYCQHLHEERIRLPDRTVPRPRDDGLLQQADGFRGVAPFNLHHRPRLSTDAGGKRQK